MIVLAILLSASLLMLFMNSGAEIAFFSLSYGDLKNLRTISRCPKNFNTGSRAKVVDVFFADGQYGVKNFGNSAF